MWGDDALVAVDLRACSGRRLPCFRHCRSLTLVRFPGDLRRIPDHAFEGCASLVGVDISVCGLLRALGSCAFRGCRMLRSVLLPHNVRSVGEEGFACSGLVFFDTSRVALSLDAHVFSGCLSLQRTSFLIAKWGMGVFAACEQLTSVAVSRVKKVDELALCGWGLGADLERTWPRRWACVFRAVRPAEGFGYSAVHRAWSHEARDGLDSMTRLTTLSGELGLLEQERFLVCEVDLSALEILPRSLSLACCFFLERVRFPRSVTEVPSQFCAWCQRLRYAGLDCCSRLRDIREHAFLGCWSLSEVRVPHSCCGRVDFDWSGLVNLDLGHVTPVTVRLWGCGLLRRLILPRVLPAVVEASANVSLCSLTFGGVRRVSGRWTDGMRPAEVRYLSLHCHEGSDLACSLSHAQVIGEVAALSGRSGRPALAS
jgi:hypothetical protein